MDENTNWKPNEQGRDSIANNANDWRSQLEPDLRKRILIKIGEWMKKLFPKHSQNDIDNTALIFEEKTYGMATDKSDYIRKIKERMTMMDKRAKNAQSSNLQSGSSVNGTNIPDPAAQVLNQGQSLPTSFQYTQTPKSQQWLPQNIQSNLNIPGSSGTVSAAQSVNIQMGEGVHSNLLPDSQRQMQGRQRLLPQQQQQPQNSNMFQHQMNQHLSYMQQHVQPPQQLQSLLKQPFQQQLSHQTSLLTNQQSFPQSSSMSTVPSSCQQTSIQQNSQLSPRPQFPTQRVRSSHPHQIAAPSQEQKQQEQEKLISQLMNGPEMQQKHLTSGHNKGEQQVAFRVPSSQQNKIASNQAMAKHNNNLQNMHQQRLSSHSNNFSALPSQQQQKISSGQSCNFIVPGSSLLGTQVQEVGLSQPMMYQPKHPQQPQNRTLQQRMDDTQRFQAAGSLRQTQNIADQQNQQIQLQRASSENPSTCQDITGQTVNASGGDWQEETYQKIKALKEMYLPVLSTMLQKVMDKLRQLDFLPQQTMLYKPTKKLKADKSMLEQVIMFLNVRRSGISEKHREKFPLYEEQVLRCTKNQTVLWRPMQQQQGQFLRPQIHQTALQSQSPQVNMSQSLENDVMNSRLMASNQNGDSSSVSGLHSLQTRPKMEPRDENNIMASSGNDVLPSLKQNPQVVHSNISSVQSSLFQQQQSKQFHHHQVQQQLLHRQLQQQPLQQVNQQFQMPTSHQTNDVRMKPWIHTKAGLLQQHLSSSQRQLPKPLDSPAQIQHHSSLQLMEQQILPATVNKTGTPSQSGGSPFVSPSPVTSFGPSPVPRNPENPISVESPVSLTYQFQTAAQPPSFGVVIKSTLDPPFTLPPEPNTERPIDRLIKAFQSSSQKSLAESVSELSYVINMTDRLAGSFHSSGGSGACLAEDLSTSTKLGLQARNLNGEPNPTKRLKRSLSTQPLDIASQTDSLKQFSSLESEVDSTASSGSKVNKVEPDFALLQEINEINGRLLETVVNICDEDVNPREVTSGTIVTCSYSPVALSATFKAHYKSGQLSQIQPLRLLVPVNYPKSSPILVENIPLDVRYETCVEIDQLNIFDLSGRTRSRFSLCMRGFSEPMSLKDIAQMWNDCARATMAEYAERYGGGTFSSKYGTWETVLRSS